MTGTTSDLAVMTTRRPPWLGLGTPIGRQMPVADAMTEGGLGFTVSLRRTFYETRSGEMKENINKRHVARDDTEEAYGVSSDSYGLVQYRDAFAFLDQLKPTIAAVGPLKGVRQAFMVVQLPGHETIDLRIGDEVDTVDIFAVLRTSHDLSRAKEVALLALRRRSLVELTLPSFQRPDVQRWSYRHVKSLGAQDQERQRLITNLPRYAESLQHTARLLSTLRLTTDEAQEILEFVLEDKPQRGRTIETILDLWQNAVEVGFHPTGWGLLMALASYLEWGDRGSNRTDQSRFLGALESATYKHLSQAAQHMRARALRSRR